jgi:hypothetical protein
MSKNKGGGGGGGNKPSGEVVGADSLLVEELK